MVHRKFLLLAAGLMLSLGLLSCSRAIPARSEAIPAERPRVRVVPVSGDESPIPTATHGVEATPTTSSVSVLSTANPSGEGRRVDHVPAPPMETFLPHSSIKPGVEPVSYLANPCFYLENRWGEGKSHPGTVVVPIMFHSVVQPGRLIADTTSITMAYFEYFMETAQDLGFSTITTDELVAFLEHNQSIPERSMILILDDRRPGVTELFMPYLEENDWTLTLGWIAADTTRASVWEMMTALAGTGRLDVQSHGFNHIYVQDYVDAAQIEEELVKPIEVIQARFGTTPLAHVWPGGNFNALSIALAGEAGYKIGFTAYSRGPILFNWVPLGEPELAMDAPLMVLPRFWSTGAVQALEEAVRVSEEAKAYATAMFDAEQAYYHDYCLPLGSE